MRLFDHFYSPQVLQIMGKKTLELDSLTAKAHIEELWSICMQQDAAVLHLQILPAAVLIAQ